MIDPAVVLAVMLLHHPWADRAVSSDVRARALEPVANAIAEVAETRAEAARLIALAWHESRFAIAVVRNGCNGLPISACDHRRARGAFQLHASACSEAYAHRAGTEASIQAEVRCAARLMRGYVASCGREASAYEGMALGHCGRWYGAAERVKTARRIERELEREGD